MNKKGSPVKKILFAIVLSILIFSCGSNYSSKMILVKGGTIPMGLDWHDVEPLKGFNISVGDFYLSKYEVTFDEFIKFLNDAGVSNEGTLHGNDVVDFNHKSTPIKYNNKFYFQASEYAFDSNVSAVDVSWFGAVEYCNWLSKKDGKDPVYLINAYKVKWNKAADGYRLPTETERYYAEKGGENSSSLTGLSAVDLLKTAWHFQNAKGILHKPGILTANELGLFDMLGNVWEWCWDWYGDFAPGGKVNYEGPLSGSTKICQGGGWFDGAAGFLETYRFGQSPHSADSNIGFRVAASVIE